MPAPFPPVSDEDLADLRSRLRRTRWADDWPASGWDAGTDPDVLRRLVDRWADGFDWRAAEREIADLPWGVEDLDGTPLAYLRFEASAPRGLPVILTNGWPSSALELVPLARLLAEAGHTAIVPALPGFPFSPQRPRHDEQTHDLWHALMTRLGFARYAAHGGDLGAGITSRLAQDHPESVAGIHLLAVAPPLELDETTLSDAERSHVARVQDWLAREGAYQHQQQTRPLTLAPALSDSPVGLLAWILEKHRAWSDSGGDVFSRFDEDYLLTLASLYWFTNTIGTSFRPYWEFAAGFTTRVRRVEVPTALAVFPHDLAQPPREWAERAYAVTRYTTMPRGGHFAPHEEPELLADDLRAFLATLD
ncbi:epoxide hydrolase family protein [Microbacterium rhizophilus]|uniref:epoxide hydrolase family protein n=1 Tax=Microbacterium rhizophilus TaxID=3138934 RepID=UPI0031E83513